MGLPKHIAIIMDGNGRWAKQRSQPRMRGHEAGAEALRKSIRFCVNNNIQTLTLFAFSCENWGRPQREVDFLMKLFLRFLEKEIDSLMENNIQLRIIGDISAFNNKLQQRIHEAQQRTEKNTGLILVVAANYSGRWDIKQAIASEEEFEKALCLSDLPEPDLLIRTSGEQRISNFLLWQMAYTELYFTNVLWPDFNETEFQKALDIFAQRERRYGLAESTEEDSLDG